MKEIIFATGNEGKIKSALRHFAHLPVVIVAQDYGFEEPDINDIEEIAREKAIYAYKQCGKPCFALDSGFYIPSYPDEPNFPGAFPKREIMEKIGIDGLLDKMSGVADRRCYFKECLVYYDGVESYSFYGITSGTLAMEKRGNDSNKKWSDLWYVFIPDNEVKTMAEMTDLERQNRHDHHTDAIHEFSRWYASLKQYTLKK